MFRRPRGFTLVELMVAIAVVGIVAIVIYRLFAVTSDNFREVDQLADANERVRFALERVRYDLQAAGAQSSPDTDLDTWVEPTVAGIRVAGLVPYSTWQNQATAAEIDPTIAAANPNVSFDGVVVIGAFDFPLSFELSGLIPTGGARSAFIADHQKGLRRLAGQDPFEGIAAPPTSGGAQIVASLQTNWTTRLIRILDRQGYMQFVQPLALAGALQPASATQDYQYLSFQVPDQTDPLGPKFKGGVNDWYGLDDLPEGDVAYDAALLDAYWIHAAPDTANPLVVNLVRERLCAEHLVKNAFGAGWDPTDSLAAQCTGGVAERVVLASHLADFQVWFDCADATGAVVDATWGYTWDPPDHEGSGDCMDSNAPDPGLVRAAHVRIALHTRSERNDMQHTQFEDALGAVCSATNPNSCSRPIDALRLRTFDSYPDTQGAAQVVLMQTDFEIVNFVNRNAVGP